jgi:enterochelin esterase family protein
MRKTHHSLFAEALSAMLLFACLPVAAQQPQPATPNSTLKSPEVLPDRQVTFRIYAPKATEVTINGDFVAQGRAKGGPLTKEDNGVWSITIGPLVPDFYSYAFMVDGVRTVDPKNARIKPGINDVTNMFEVPGEQAEYEDTRLVPHGEVRAAWYQSSTLDMMRSMHVYTPPGYDSGNVRYPVFYLLHGGGDDDSGWSTIGRAGFILDNLLAEKKIKPMIVVMPNGSMPPSANRTQAQTTDLFADELLKNVIPFVEKNYRVIANRENRAIAGLSMGAGQTLRVVPYNLDKFAYAGMWSNGIRPEQQADFEKNNEAFLKNPAKTNKDLKVLYLAVGEHDTVVGGRAQALDALLTADGIKHEFHVTEGGHTWINWRHYLHDYSQLLFR